MTFNASFPTGVNSYRAYLLPWNPGSSSGHGWGGGQGGWKQNGSDQHGRAAEHRHGHR